MLKFVPKMFKVNCKAMRMTLFDIVQESLLLTLNKSIHFIHSIH